MRPVRTVATDGSPDAAAALADALLAALSGDGPAVLPTGPDGAGPDGSGPDGSGPDEAGPAPILTAPVDDDVALVVTTSGSTGSPKGVLLPGTALGTSAEATHAHLGRIVGEPGPGRWLLALPAHHVAGVQVLLRSALAGFPAAVMDLRNGFRPRDFASAADAAGARYVSLVPTQVRRLLDDPDPAGVEALRGFAAVLLGGAAADQALLERARGAGVSVVTTYGMSETCGGCVYDGRPLPGVEVSLVDGPRDDEGRIVLGGPTVGAGYRGPRAALSPDEREAFAVPGWFRTADLGRWRADGRLEVLGRVDDMIVTGGENVAPARVERALLAVDGVREACVVGVPDPEWGARVVAAVVGDPGGVGLAGDAVRVSVATELGRAAPREVRVVGELPLRGIGKPDRVAVRRWFTG